METKENPGTKGDDVKTETPIVTEETQFTQSDLDRAISQAIATREKNLRAQQEQEKQEIEKSKLIAEQKFKELAELNERKIKQLELDKQTNRILAAKNLNHLSPLFDVELANVDGREKFADSLNAIIETTVEQRIAERLKTTPPPIAGAKPTEFKRFEEMTKEEYLAWKQANKN